MLLRIANGVVEAFRTGDGAGMATCFDDGERTFSATGLSDAIAVAAGFNAITRIADAIGIPLETTADARVGDAREVIGITEFARAKVNAD